jgi:RNA polymerase sigma-70 factor (ECF subfamily)
MTPEQVEFSARIRPLLKRLDGFVAARVPNQYVDDICSETIAIAWTKRASLPAAGAESGADPLLGFLVSTARFQIKNLSRRLNTSTKHMWELLQKNAASAEDVALRDTSLFEALGRLRQADRELLILAAWDELTINEIAEVLSTSARNVSVRLSRARKRLAAILQEIESEQR